MEEFFQQLVIGLQNGAIYASLALALVLIFRTTGLLNFAQGEMAMIATYITWALHDAGVPIWIAIGGSMVFAFGLGAGVERAFIRPLGAGHESALAVVIVTLGLFIGLNGVASYVWGPQAKTFEAKPFSGETVDVGGVNVKIEAIGIVVVLLVVVGLLFLLLERTKLGLGLRAVASNRESAELCGIHVGRTLMIGWGLAAALGALAGGLFAPSVALTPATMQIVLIYAFAAATLGGFDSPIGAVVGGAIVGVTESLSGTYVDVIGRDLALATAFVLIMSVLLVRPQGLFGKKVVARV